MASGAATGSAIGGLIDPPKGPTIIGPRLSDLSQQNASYGASIPRIYGSAPVYGNIFWIENNSLKETVHKDNEGGKGGGGGSEVKTFTYSATFALGLCRGEIAGIRRIWVSGKLIYDAGVTDVDAIAASNRSANGFTVYRGTEDQMPNPRMQSALGAANTPAIRGLAYIVFEDFELTDYGNSLAGAQIKVEIVNSGTYTDWDRTTTVTDSGVAFGKSGAAGVGLPYINGVNGEVRVAIVGTLREFVFSRNGQFIAEDQIDSPACAGDVTVGPTTYRACGKLIYDYGGLEEDLLCNPRIFPLEGPTLARGIGVPTLRIDHNLPQDRTILNVALANDRKSILVISGDIGVYGHFGGTHYSAVWTLISADGDFISSGAFPGGIGIAQLGFGRSVNYSFSSCCYDQDSGILAAAWGAGSGHVWIYRFDDSGNLTLESTENLSYFNFTYPSIYCENGVVFVVSEKHFNVFTRGLLSQSYPQLKTIVDKECAESAVLSPADIDSTSLADTVMGYRVSAAGSLRSGMEPLQAAWPFDAVQAGYQIKFIRRTGLSSAATIPPEDLGASSDGKRSPQLVQTREMDSQLAGRVIVTHLDADREYDIGEQDAERLNTGTITERRVELSIVLSSTDAKQVAEMMLYRYWMERYDFTFSLPPSYRHLEPCDVVTVVTDDATYDFRLTRVQYQADGTIDCDAKLHAPIYTSTAIGADGVASVSKLEAPGSTVLQLLDIPTISDKIDAPGFLVSACGYTSSWRGANIFRSLDDGATWSSVASIATPGTIGFAAVAMGAPIDFRLIDKKNTLTAKFYGGQTVSSVTEQQMLTGQNHFAYGAHGRWEIIAAQNATLQGDGSYVLSDLLRGRFGSEWAAGLHQANDRLVLLGENAVTFVPTGTNGLGIEFKYKGVTAGQNLSDAATQTIAYAGENHECLSPVYLNGSRHPTTNDWSLNWIRRTRVGGEWRSYVDASLGEASEAYEVEIYSSAAYTTLKRTITGLTSAACAYTSADQVTDFGSNQATLYIKIYQLSANVGRGQPLTTSITR
ncbi:MAG: phage tail protein [Azonexus sp.]|nr:phage tail protein [Azonexus sp.]